MEKYSSKIMAAAESAQNGSKDQLPSSILEKNNYLNGSMLSPLLNRRRDRQDVSMRNLAPTGSRVAGPES
jgi:hypothetical protein